MIRFLTELLVRRTWFGQFDELYFVLNWLVMRFKLRPELAADAEAMFVELGECSQNMLSEAFWTPNTSNEVREEKFAQLRTN